MKKYFILLTAIVFGAFNLCYAEPIIELSAPRIMPKVVSDDSTPTLRPKQTTSQKKNVKNSAKNKSKSGKNSIRRRRVRINRVIPVNYNKISRMVEYGYYDDADKILTAAIKKNPKDIEAQSLYVISLAKQYKLDPAQAQLNTLLKKAPNNSNLHYAQGIVYYNRRASSNMVYRGNSDKLLSDSLNEFKKAVKLDKNNAEAYNAAGVASLSLNQSDNAQAFFKKALSVDKTYATSIDNLGTLDFIAGKFDDAQKKYLQALTYNSQDTSAMYHLAQVAIKNKDYPKALEYLNDALAIDPNSPAIYNLMGKVYRIQGNEAAAVNSFKKSLSVKPEFTRSYLDLANIYTKRGDRELAVAQLRTAVSIDPSLYDAKLRMADILLSNSDYGQAAKIYSELVDVNDFNKPALKGLADSYYALAQTSSSKALSGSNKNLFKALDYVNSAIAADNKSLDLHLAKLKLSELTNQQDTTPAVAQGVVKEPASDLMGNVIKGEAYLSLYNYNDADKTFDAAADMSKTTEDDLSLIELFVYHKQYSCAEKVILKILAKDAQNQQALSYADYIQKCKKYANNNYQNAQYYVKKKNLNSAVDNLSRSLNVNPNNAQAQLQLAQLYEKQKKYEDAKVHYQAYVGLSPAAETKNISKKIKKLNTDL